VPPAVTRHVSTSDITTTFEVRVDAGDQTRSQLRAHGELDVATADRLAAILEQQRATGHRYVRLDMSGITFLDCAGLGVLVAAHHRFLAARGTLILTGLGKRTWRLLQLTALDHVLFTAAVNQPAPTEDVDDRPHVVPASAIRELRVPTTREAQEG